MKKYLTRKNFILVGLICVMSVLAGTLYVTFKPASLEEESKPNEEIIGSEEIYNPVNPLKAEEFYDSVTSSCSGVMILENGKSSCQSNDSYKQRMIGYSYEGEDLVVYVNVINIKDGHGYKLDGTDLGVYLEDKEAELLERGTTYLYKYQKNQDDYTFKDIQVM